MRLPPATNSMGRDERPPPAAGAERSGCLRRTGRDVLTDPRTGAGRRIEEQAQVAGTRLEPSGGKTASAVVDWVAAEAGSAAGARVSICFGDRLQVGFVFFSSRILGWKLLG